MTINEELWDFPHAMQLKVMGAADAPLAELVIEILVRHLGDFDTETQLRENQSSSGRYISLTASIVMENKEQLTANYAELHDSPHVTVVFSKEMVNFLLLEINT